MACETRALVAVRLDVTLAIQAEERPWILLLSSVSERQKTKVDPGSQERELDPSNHSKICGSHFVSGITVLAPCSNYIVGKLIYMYSYP